MNYDAVISILHWDTPEYLKKLIQSIAAVRNECEYLVYILDQGSISSDVFDFIHGEFAKVPEAVLTVFKLASNIGFSHGNNYVFENTKHLDFKAFITVNSDVEILEPNWVDKLVEAVEEGSDMTGPNIVRAKPNGTCDYLPAVTALGPKDFLSASLLAISKRAILSEGLFDVAYTPGYYEDADLGFRFRAKGLKLTHTSIKHIHHYKSNTKTSRIKKAELTELYGDFMKKNHDRFLDTWGKVLTGLGFINYG